MLARRTFLQALAAAPAASLWGADDELRVAVNKTTIESAPLLVQEIPGVRVVLVENGRAASAQLVSGAVDAATGSEAQAILNSVAQPDLRIVLTLSECRYRLVARKSAAIRSLTDLRRKRVAITARTSSEYFLLDMLRPLKLTLDDVKIVGMEGPDMPAAMMKYQIDAMAMWEPHAQNAIDLIGEDAVVLENPSAYFERFGINTNLRVLNDPAKRRVFARLFKETARISKELQSSRKKHLPALAKAIATPQPVIERAWSHFKFPATLDVAPLQAMLHTMEPWAATAGGRAARPNSTLDAMVDGSLLAESRK
jgi:NitT/TauT family transport system substrate-binding protein